MTKLGFHDLSSGFGINFKLGVDIRFFCHLRKSIGYKEPETYEEVTKLDNSGHFR